MVASRYLFTLDGYDFPADDEPALGPIIYYQPRKYSVMSPIGSSAVDADVYTFLGLGSQKWKLSCRAVTATKDKLLAVYNAGIAVLWKTPQDLVGVNVLMVPPFDIEYRQAIGQQKFLVDFTLVRRA